MPFQRLLLSAKAIQVSIYIPNEGTVTSGGLSMLLWVAPGAEGEEWLEIGIGTAQRAIVCSSMRSAVTLD